MSENLQSSLDQRHQNTRKKVPSSVHGYKAVDIGIGNAQTFIVPPPNMPAPPPEPSPTAKDDASAGSPIESQPTLALDLDGCGDQSYAETQIKLSPIVPNLGSVPQSPRQIRPAQENAAAASKASPNDNAKKAVEVLPSNAPQNTIALPEMEELVQSKTQQLVGPVGRIEQHHLIRITPEQKMANPVLQQLSEGTSEMPILFENEENRWDSSQIPLPEIGQMVGDYRIQSLLGKGGFGAVFSAKNLNLGRNEALKLILPSAKSEISDIEKRFSREIDIVSRLEHPNIVRLYRSGILKQQVMWMSMELVNGRCLDAIINETHGLDFSRAKRITLQILDGLILAHKSQIVHRDLKPENIIVSQLARSRDHVTILDFGLAKAFGPNEDHEVQELTMLQKFRVYGTPQYMAPEQVLRGILGPWTDVYATGLILYELLTGHAAVTGNSPADIAMSQAYGQFELPKELANTAIGDVIAKACAKRARDRYQDAGAFYDALDSIDAPKALSKTQKTSTPQTSKIATTKTTDAVSSPKRSFLLSLYLVLATLLSLAFLAAYIAWTLAYVQVIISF